MTHDNSALGEGAFGPEPEHDRKLGMLLASVVGNTPTGRVNWQELARRVSVSIDARKPAPWWSYAARWERRAIPLALAAGIAGAFTLWSASTAARSIPALENPEYASVASNGAIPSDAVRSLARSEFMSAMLDGAPATDAVRSFARSVTSAAELNFESPQ